MTSKHNTSENSSHRTSGLLSAGLIGLSAVSFGTLCSCERASPDAASPSRATTAQNTPPIKSDTDQITKTPLIKDLDTASAIAELDRKLSIPENASQETLTAEQFVDVWREANEASTLNDLKFASSFRRSSVAHRRFPTDGEISEKYMQIARLLVKEWSEANLEPSKEKTPKELAQRVVVENGGSNGLNGLRLVDISVTLIVCSEKDSLPAKVGDEIAASLTSFGLPSNGRLTRASDSAADLAISAESLKLEILRQVDKLDKSN